MNWINYILYKDYITEIGKEMEWQGEYSIGSLPNGEKRYWKR